MSDSSILFACACLWVVLSVVWLHTLAAPRPDAPLGTAVVRLRVWLIFASAELLVAATGHFVLALIAVGVLVVGGCVELARLSGQPLLTYAGALLALPFAWQSPVAVGMALVCAALVIFLLPFQARTSDRHAAILVLSFYVGLAPAALAASRPHPSLLLAVLLTLTASHMIDILSGFAGKRGESRRPLARLSPGKTVRGFAAGGAAAMAAGLLLVEPLRALGSPLLGDGQALAAPWILGVGLGVVLWAATALGDLVGSKVKRVLGVKDYGVALGPHGGVIDRLDAFVPAVVAGCLLVG